MRPVEPEHVAAGRQHRPRLASPPQHHEGLAAERRDRPSHHGPDAVAFEMAHQQIGGGGQVRHRARPVGVRALSQPLADGLAAHAEETRRVGLAQAPDLNGAPERCTATQAVESFRERIKPAAVVFVRCERPVGRLFGTEGPVRVTHSKGAHAPPEIVRRPLPDINSPSADGRNRRAITARRRPPPNDAPLGPRDRAFDRHVGRPGAGTEKAIMPYC